MSQLSQENQKSAGPPDWGRLDLPAIEPCLPLPHLLLSEAPTPTWPHRLIRRLRSQAMLKQVRGKQSWSPAKPVPHTQGSLAMPRQGSEVMDSLTGESSSQCPQPAGLIRVTWESSRSWPSPHSLAWELSNSPNHCWGKLLAPKTKNPGQNTEKLRVWQAKLLSLQWQPGVPVWPENSRRGQLESRPERALSALELVLPLRQAGKLTLKHHPFKIIYVSLMVTIRKKTYRNYTKEHKNQSTLY